ncbi:DUF6062 family protein [Capillibacterium thermochitinicola]|uniref:Uncharacterized protein n=1 Tax=Capillibacterium thermochitinicola TaxID=2699427 RepID=A0A8J6HX91_9FIRM|nr:DUF6062 family protein [Capillibacterium thermochitinicola]MBA2133077.1 hypothetical protein [Capillibacterium thermochitinicola]
MKPKDVIVYNLEQALGASRCPLCHCLAAATKRYLANFLYESVNDPRIRDQLRAAGGFCREHSRVLQRMGDPLAHSIIYADLIEACCAELDQTAGDARKGHSLLRADKERACAVCQEEAAMADRYVDGLLGALRNSAFREKYRQEGCLCLPHFRQVYDRSRNNEERAFLVEVQTSYLSRLSGELKEFIRKSDYRYAHELPGTERDAWIRAVRFWVGPLDGEA